MRPSRRSDRARRPGRAEWLDYTRLLAWAASASPEAARQADRAHRDAYQWKLGRRSLRNEYRRAIVPAPPPAN